MKLPIVMGNDSFCRSRRPRNVQKGTLIKPQPHPEEARRAVSKGGRNGAMLLRMRSSRFDMKLVLGLALGSAPAGAGVEGGVVLPSGSLMVQTSARRRSFRVAIWSSICLLAAFCLSIWSSSALTCACVGTRRRGRRRRRGQLHRHVHDRPIEQVPAEPQAGGEQQEAAQQAAQDQRPAGAADVRRQRRRVGHGDSWAPVEGRQSTPVAAEFGRARAAIGRNEQISCDGCGLPAYVYALSLDRH